MVSVQVRAAGGEVSKDTAIRCITLPVAEPIGSSWEALNAALKGSFRLSTDLANWAVHRLYGLDMPGQAKLPATITEWYGYGDAGLHFPAWGDWAGAMSSAQCVLRGVHRKYKQDRFGFMVRGDRILNFRYPYPFPVHNKDWKAGYADGGFPQVELPLPGIGRVTIRLKRRADFGRQLAGFRDLVEGAAKKGEAALYRNGKGDLLLKLVGHFPKRDRGKPLNVAYVSADPAALLVVEVNGHKANVTNGDHIRREFARTRSMIGRHKAFLERARQDKKREVRMDRRQRASLNKFVADRCDKQNARVQTFAKQVAAQVARMCERKGVGVVCYDDAATGFMPDFPWHALKTRIHQIVVGEMGCDWIAKDSDGMDVGRWKNGFTTLADPKEKDEWLRLAKAATTAGKRQLASRRRTSSHPKVAPR
jgi:hypothetical protein